jgi:hypothetical protein
MKPDRAKHSTNRKPRLGILTGNRFRVVRESWKAASVNYKLASVNTSHLTEKKGIGKRSVRGSLRNINANFKKE